MHRHGKSHKSTWLIGAVVVVAVALVATSYALFSAHHKPPAAAATTEPTTKAGKPAIMQVTAASPAPGASNVTPNTLISLQLTEPLAANSPMPQLDPPVTGTWVESAPTTLVFEPTESFVPGESETVVVPAGDAGLEGVNGAHASTKLTIGFQVATGSTLRLQQLLAELGYLPLSFTPASTAPVSALNEAVPQVGTFSWKWGGVQSFLSALWSPGFSNVVTQGAIMNFENVENITTDGIAGPKVWADLLQAVKTHSMDPNPYDYVYVQKNPLPETATVYRNGQAVYSTLANTGIAAAPTPDGTWPVYARYVSTTMRGTNPNGTPYVDPGIPWVSYFYDGDALHGFNRSTYGWPQSLGCVEMPPANAGVVFPYTPIGTLVTVQ
jgi:peptidoglycan hydrolase-like protein with peptidoglycan-binding domain